MNTCCFVGNMVRDPELRYTQSGTPVANVTIAVNRPFKNQQGQYDADFIDLVFWRKAAEIINQYGAKGKTISVVGRLETRSYEASDGSRRKSVTINVDEFKFIGSRRNGNNGENGYAEGTGEVDEISPDDVPF